MSWLFLWTTLQIHENAAPIANANALLKNTTQPSPSPIADGIQRFAFGNAFSSTGISTPISAPIRIAQRALSGRLATPFDSTRATASHVRVAGSGNFSSAASLGIIRYHAGTIARVPKKIPTN